MLSQSKARQARGHPFQEAPLSCRCPKQRSHRQSAIARDTRSGPPVPGIFSLNASNDSFPRITQCAQSSKLRDFHNSCHTDDTPHVDFLEPCRSRRRFFTVPSKLHIDHWNVLAHPKNPIAHYQKATWLSAKHTTPHRRPVTSFKTPISIAKHLLHCRGGREDYWEEIRQHAHAPILLLG